MAGKPAVNLTGGKFGHFTVLYRHGSYNGSAVWMCRCDCGNLRPVVAYALRIGKSQSCGCVGRAKFAAYATTHGKCYTATFKTWVAMRFRCRSDREQYKKYYKDRGITVCERWEKFENFLADMGERPDGKSIDRIDNDRGYSLDNCRWATPKEQVDNRRPGHAPYRKMKPYQRRYRDRIIWVGLS